jgi:hypothetical protein
MRKLSAKWVHKFLNADQKRDRVRDSQAILHRFRLHPVGFFNRLITMDETWIRIYDTETKGRKFSGIEEATLAAGGWFAAQPKEFSLMG